MTIRATLYDQFRLPRGPLGVLAGRIMAKRSSNQERSAWTVELLELEPHHRVLELGFGPGLGLEAARPHLTTGRLVGLDHSSTMATMAARRLNSSPGAARPELRIGEVESMPDDIGTFDRIFSCNVWLFWPEPVAVFASLRPHLAPGGVIAVTHLPRHGNATRATSLAAADRITDQLTVAGYSHVRRELLELEPAPAVCVLATNP